MWRMTIVYKYDGLEEVLLFKNKEIAEYFRDYFYKDDKITYVRIDEIEEE
ncbi:hypothetical protein [Clostridium sp.]|nr:hypothetical protein [Clostridium sp.]